MRRALKSLATFSGTFCPRSGGQNLNDTVASSWRSARENNSRSTRRCGLVVYHEVRVFPFGRGRRRGVSRHHRSPKKYSGACVTEQLELARVQRIGGVGGLDVDLAHGFRSQRSPEYLHLHGLPAKRRQRHPQTVGRARSSQTTDSELRQVLFGRRSLAPIHRIQG